jgi:tetratricopeptide (TPR) repeat protein
MAVSRRVASMLEEFAKRAPLDAKAQLVLGQAYFGIAERLMDQQKYDESVEARTKSIEVLRALVTQHPDDAQGQRFLAQTEKRLAYLYLIKLHDFAKAAQHLNISLKIDQDRVARDPADSVAKLDLALGNSYLSGLTGRRGDVEGALRYQLAAVAARAEVLAADPRNARTRYLLITDQARLGGLLRDLHRTTEAKAAFDRGFQLGREGDPESMKDPEALAALGELRKASLGEKLQQRQ